MAVHVRFKDVPISTVTRSSMDFFFSLRGRGFGRLRICVLVGYSEYFFAFQVVARLLSSMSSSPLLLGDCVIH